MEVITLSAYTHTHHSQSYYNRYKRDPVANAFYQSQVWEHMAARVKAESYNTCAICGHTYDEPGKLITDHIVPLRVDKRKRLDRDNLWCLCQQDHYWKTKLEGQVYQSESLIENLDTAKRWGANECKKWVLEHKRRM
jgi:5-methylcytosine-specific restriction endonuclease McrA